jgi:hypothetical protein
VSPLSIDGFSRPLRPSVRLGEGKNRVPDLVTNHQKNHPDRLIFVTQIIDTRRGPQTGFQLRSRFYSLGQLYPYGWDSRMECKPISELAADVLEAEFPGGVRWGKYQGQDSIIARSFEGREVILRRNTNLEEGMELLPLGLEELRASPEPAMTAVLCVCDPNSGHLDRAEKHSPLVVYAHLPPLDQSDPAKKMALAFARALQNII